MQHRRARTRGGMRQAPHGTSHAARGGALFGSIGPAMQANGRYPPHGPDAVRFDRLSPAQSGRGLTETRYGGAVWLVQARTAKRAGARQSKRKGLVCPRLPPRRIMFRTAPLLCASRCREATFNRFNRQSGGRSDSVCQNRSGPAGSAFIAFTDICLQSIFLRGQILPLQVAISRSFFRMRASRRDTCTCDTPSTRATCACVRSLK